MKREFYLITYDIGDDYRLAKVHQFLKDFGQSVQKSVFECWLTKKELEYIISWLTDFIDHTKDQVRIYHSCYRCIKKAMCFGKPGSSRKPKEALFL